MISFHFDFLLTSRNRRIRRKY